MTLSNDKTNDSTFEQQKSESQVASLKNQVEGNYVEDSQEAADNIAENLDDAKGNK